MFRVFVIVLLAALPVIVLGLIAGPLAAVVLLGLELVVAALVWRRTRAERLSRRR
jgi:hypothetical protein